jgi:hypothetical protein
MDNFIGSKKMVYFFVIIGVVAIIAMIAVGVGKKPATNQPGGNNQGEAKITKTDVDKSKLPDKFPADIPQEEGATITKNDVQTATDGRFQATRSYISANSVDENAKIFQSYFQKNAWTVTGTVTEPNYRAISAEKGSLSMQISINDNQVTDQKTVDMYLVEKVSIEPK